MATTTATTERETRGVRDGDRLNEVAAILAAGFLRLHAKHVSGQEKRRFTPDNLLELPAETGPHAIRP